jgi:putative IMPACT (imprinted ancient) family translation regulator
MKLFENIITDRGSKYSVCGASVTTKDDALSVLKELKKNKKYAKATHNTWAVLLKDIAPLKMMMERLERVWLLFACLSGNNYSTT